MSESVGFATLQIVPSAKGFGSTLNGQIASPMRRSGEAGGKAYGGGLVGAAAKFAAPLAAAFAGVKVVGFFKDAVAGAGDLQQSVGAIETVFKGGSAQMLKWSDNAATAVGLTQNEYNQLGTLIGTQLKNGGTAMDDLGSKTNNLIGLGADLSSMFGGTTAEAVGALSSALKGERDPIERFGVSLTQTAIDAKAAELGFKKVGGALSTEANQAATLALIMDQTADAHGNFAKEGDTLQHKQQVLAAGWETLKTKLGTAFLPVVTSVIGVINDKFLPIFDKIVTAVTGVSTVLAGGKISEEFTKAFGADGAQKIVDVVTKIRDVVMGVFDTFSGKGGDAGGMFSGILASAAPLLGTFNDFLPAVTGVSDAFSEAFTALSPMNILMEALKPLLPQLTAALSTLAGTLISSLKPVLPVIAKVAGTLAGTLGQAVGTLVPIVLSLVNTLGPILGQVIATLVPIIANLAATLGPILGQVIATVLPVVGQLATMLGGLLGNALVLIMPVLGQVAAILAQVLGQAIVALLPVVTTLIGVVMELMPTIFSLIPPILSVVKALLPLVGVVGDLITSLLPPLLKVFMALLKPILALVPVLVTALVPILTTLAEVIATTLVPWITKLTSWLVKWVDFLAPVVALIAGGLVSALTAVIGVLVKVVAGIVTFVVEAVGKFTEFATNVGTAVEDVVTFFRDLPGKIGDLFTGAGTWLLQSGKDIITGLINGAKELLPKIGEQFLDVVPGWIKTPFKKALGIHSPSKVFHGFGGNIVQGLVNGVKAGRESIVATIKDMSDAITKTQDAAVKKETARILESIRVQNKAITAENKKLKKGQKKQALIPTLTSAQATAQAKKNLGSAEAAKAAKAILALQAKTTKSLWKKGAGAGTDALLNGLTSSGNFKSGASAAVKGSTLADMAKATDVLAARLANARDKLADLKAEHASMKADVSNSIQGELDLTSGVEDGGKPTFASVSGAVKALASRAKKFADRLNSLVKAGIPKGLVQEVAGLGSEQGIAVADALLSGSKAQIKDLSADYAAISTYSDKAGKVVADQMYGVGIAAQEGIVKGLTDDSSKLAAATKKLTDKITKQVKKNLGIKSPSRVFKALGVYTAEGMALGLESGIGRVQDAADALTPTGSAFGTPDFAASKAAAASASGPNYLVVVDSDGALVGRMQIEAGRVQKGAVTPLHLGRAAW